MGVCWTYQDTIFFTYTRDFVYCYHVTNSVLIYLRSLIFYLSCHLSIDTEVCFRL
jgi:hypothetical protein